MKIKRLLLSLVIVLACYSLLSAGMVDKLKTVIARQTVAAGGCNPANDEVGSRAGDGTPRAVGIGHMHCVIVTADCTGDLGDAYIWEDTVTSGDVKVSVYTYDGSGDPDVNSVIVGTSATIAAENGDGVRTAAMDGGSVTQDAEYLVCAANDDDSGSGWDMDGGSSVAVYYTTGLDAYDAEPATLDGFGSNSIAWGPYYIYVTIE